MKASEDFFNVGVVAAITKRGVCTANIVMIHRAPHWREPSRKSRLNVVPLDVTAARLKLITPPFLSKAERRLFTETALANPHLTPGDAPLLAVYVQGLVKVHKLAKGIDVVGWEKAVRAVLSLATKLRLTPQSTVHPETAGRKRPQLPPSAYDLMVANDDDD